MKKEILEITVKSMVQNGLKSLEDFVNALEKLDVKGQDLAYATQLFLEETRDLTIEPVKEENESDKRVRELSKGLSEACEDLADGMKFTEVVQAVGVLGNFVCTQTIESDEDEWKDFTEAGMTVAIEMLDAYLTCLIVDGGTLPDLNVFYNAIFHLVRMVTDEKAFTMAIVKIAEKATRQIEDLDLDEVLEQLTGLSSDDLCEHFNEPCECDDCEDCEEECEEKLGKILGGCAVSCNEEEAESIMRAASALGVPFGVLKIDKDDVSPRAMRVLEKAMKSGMDSLTKEDFDVMKELLLKAM